MFVILTLAQEFATADRTSTPAAGGFDGRFTLASCGGQSTKHHRICLARLPGISEADDIAHVRLMGSEASNDDCTGDYEDDA